MRMRALVVVLGIVLVSASCGGPVDTQYRGTASRCVFAGQPAPNSSILLILSDGERQHALLGIGNATSVDSWATADAASVHFDDKTVSVKGAFDSGGGSSDAFALVADRTPSNITGTLDFHETGSAVSCASASADLFTP